MPYIPDAHKQFNLLPMCTERGEEVFVYPEDDVYEIEELTKENIVPYGYDSYETYYAMLDSLIDKYIDNHKIQQLLLDIKEYMLDVNQKEKWSVVKYTGESGDELFDLINGQCYYWPTDQGEFLGIIDGEEFSNYACDPIASEWEIMCDPTGMAQRTLYPPDEIVAHKFSSNHKPELEKDSVCGCFYCLTIFHPSEIKEWIIEDTAIDSRGTAICPYCSIDSVIGESSGYPITEEFLEKMQEHWF